jgi:iron complex transport system permease protein
VHLGLGARWIAPQTVLQALFHYDPRNFDHRIIVDLRLVRLAAALLTGAALGVADAAANRDPQPAGRAAYSRP